MVDFHRIGLFGQYGEDPPYRPVWLIWWKFTISAVLAHTVEIHDIDGFGEYGENPPYLLVWRIW
jgi:hypothetical protein